MAARIQFIGRCMGASNDGRARRNGSRGSSGIHVLARGNSAGATGFAPGHITWFPAEAAALVGGTPEQKNE